MLVKIGADHRLIPFAAFIPPSGCRHGCETESGTELKSCSNFKLARHSGTAGVALSVLALILHISFAGCAPSMQAAVAAAAVSVAAAISIIIALTSWAEFVKEGLKPEYPDIKNADAITMEIVAIIAHFLTLPCVYFAAKALTPNTDYVVIHNSASVRLTTAQQDSYMLQPQQHMQQQPYPPQAYPGQPPQQYYPPQYPTQPPHGTYVPPNVPLSTDGK